jgi:hypothetical protein
VGDKVLAGETSEFVVISQFTIAVPSLLARRPWSAAQIECMGGIGLGVRESPYG